jgi:hypothetical protein
LSGKINLSMTLEVSKVLKAKKGTEMLKETQRRLEITIS